MTPAAAGGPPGAFDYVVVGSGPGGGPLAARLAEAGMRVLLLEAGQEHDDDNYLVPAFHSDASEDPAQRWDCFVRHYADEEQHLRDTKAVPGKGILYPRASAVGGCTAHHALITVYPYNSDFDAIARDTGDTSWNSRAMRGYFERIERCGYRERPRLLPRGPLLSALARSLPFVSERYVNKSRHGWDGWLPTTLADPALVIEDPQLLKVILSAAESGLAGFLGRPLSPLEGFGSLVDPNDWRVQTRSLEGLWQIPLSTDGGRRSAVRERLAAVRAARPDRLVVRTGVLVTRVLIDEDGTATGVEYAERAHAHRADPLCDPGAALPALQRVSAAREVVLSAGAFGTPQLLMLSGVGPREELERHGIEVRADSPGVGGNLQDRYEVGVVSRTIHDFPLLRDCSFHAPAAGDEPDRCYRAWQRGRGLYTTNGSVIGLTRRSRPDLPDPDLFVFGLPADFRGYYPGYSREVLRHKDRFTWAILKARTRNTAGTVRLRSADPRDTPLVDFHHFTEGSDRDGLDLEAMADAVAFVRGVNERAGGALAAELWPGPGVDTREKVRRWVRDEAWGHHASCTARIGPDGDPLAVLDSRFRVRGVRRLRVVDASVFPRVPGFFVATPLYMISEKASDVILADALPRHARRARGRRAGPRATVPSAPPPAPPSVPGGDR
ncbi:GMC family oxidoreductase [Streptomyces sp. NPDC001941]|uniref:GMC family oxidoreductase n=1 Tax=Streptomyces sp. NPDC001941 TaxID=3154659 RepID=UPI0033336999